MQESGSGSETSGITSPDYKDCNNNYHDHASLRLHEGGKCQQGRMPDCRGADAFRQIAWRRENDNQDGVNNYGLFPILQQAASGLSDNKCFLPAEDYCRARGQTVCGTVQDSAQLGREQQCGRGYRTVQGWYVQPFGSSKRSMLASWRRRQMD